AIRREMPARVRRIAGGIAEALGCRAEVDIAHGHPAVVNDPEVAEIAWRAAASVVGEAGVVVPKPTMGGEDMALYLERVPGCYVFIGSANRSAASPSRTTAPSSTSTRRRWPSAVSFSCASRKRL
ncbi:MAG TPA: M20/M25/M40 family metallo-hydrolase, partial [Vicinamibacteria bacterium]